MSSRKLQQRYARAEADAKAAAETHDQERQAQSRTFLKSLLRQSVDERFAALASSGDASELIAADRLTLLRSIPGATDFKRVISNDVATWFEIWRSRLRYKVFTLIMGGVVVITVAGVSIMAYQRTPKMLVGLGGNQVWEVDWKGADGNRSKRSIAPGEARYQLIKIEGDLAILKSWEPGVGYAEFRLPVKVLVRIK